MDITINNLYEQIGRLYASLAATQTELVWRKESLDTLRQENDTLRLAIAQNEEVQAGEKAAPKE